MPTVLRILASMSAVINPPADVAVTHTLLISGVVPGLVGHFEDVALPGVVGGVFADATVVADVVEARELFAGGGEFAFGWAVVAPVGAAAEAGGGRGGEEGEEGEEGGCGVHGWGVKVVVVMG